MKRQYANELIEGTKVDAPFALRSKELRAARSGEAYLALDLADRTGTIPAVCFRPSHDVLSVPSGCVVHVRGLVTAYRGVKRISVDFLRAASTWDTEDILASGVRPADELWAEFSELVASVTDSELRGVLRAVFSDRTFLERFKSCPGSQAYHHAYAGGLLEHTVTVATLCRGLAGTYPTLDGDLLTAAALLHDVGKCEELSFETGIEYTDEGRLMGHVALSVRRLDRSLARARTRIRRERLMLLEHIILSHHGELEWGSPKRPSTLEALMLHHVDNLDAKVSGFSALLSSAARVDERWTDAGNLFRRPLWAPSAAEDDRPFVQSEDTGIMRRSA